MKFVKLNPRLQSISIMKNWLLKKSSGQMQWIMGMFSIMFLLVLIMFELQIASFRSSSAYLEDALAGSGLASLLIDVREYGESGNMIIRNMEGAYDRYKRALIENLGIENGIARNLSLISGEVKTTDYRIYNVIDGKVYEYEIIGDSFVLISQGDAGNINAPNGQVVNSTGVYSKIEFSIKGFLGITVNASKSKLVEINQRE